MKLIIKMVVVTMLSLAFLACSNAKKTNEEAQTKIDKSRKPLATIDGKVLYEDEFFDFSSMVLKEMDKEAFGNAAIKEQLMRDFIEHNVLLAEARRKGVEIDNKKIGSVLSSFKTNEGAQDLKVYSGSYSTNENKLAKLMEERLLIETLLNTVVNANIAISEKELQDYYKNNEEFSKPSRRAHVLHIFTTEKETAEKAMKELQRGISFNEVAERYSEGPEKNYGGDLGFISDKDFPEIFSEAFKLPVNRASPIVQSEYGFHIFLVKEYDKGKKISFENARPKLYFEIYAEKQEKETRKYIDEIYKKTNIKYLNDVNLNDFNSEANKR